MAVVTFMTVSNLRFLQWSFVAAQAENVHKQHSLKKRGGPEGCLHSGLGRKHGVFRSGPDRKMEGFRAVHIRAALWEYPASAPGY